MRNFYSLAADDGAIDISYSDKTVLIHSISGNGFEYLDSLLYSIAGKVIKPALILIPESYTQVIRDNCFIASGVVLEKAELYYLGNKKQITACLYDYFLDRYGVEPFDNEAFLIAINSPHKTMAYRLDTFVTV